MVKSSSSFGGVSELDGAGAAAGGASVATTVLAAVGPSVPALAGGGGLASDELGAASGEIGGAVREGRSVGAARARGGMRWAPGRSNPSQRESLVAETPETRSAKSSAFVA